MTQSPGQTFLAHVDAALPVRDEPPSCAVRDAGRDPRRRLGEFGARILVVTPQPFFKVSGTPIAVAQLCRALSDAGHAIDIVSFPCGSDIELPGLVQHRTRRLPLVGDVSIGFSTAKVAYDVALASKVVRMLRRDRYDVVHAVEEAAFFVAPICRRLDIPLVMDLDSDIYEQLRIAESPVARALARPSRRLRRHALHIARCAVTMAPALSQLVAEVSPRTRVFEIRDFALPEMLREPDASRVAELRARLDLETRRVIAYTGNLDRRQGVDMLVEAVAKLVPHYPDLALLIVGGEHDEIEQLHGAAREAGVYERLYAIGRRPLGMMAEYMALADVLVSPRLEPLMTPMKIYSYMASGRPIVATDLPTHKEVLGPDCASLAPPTVEGIARQIATLLDDPERAWELGQHARRRALSFHTFERFQRQVAEAYDFVLAGQAPAHLRG